MIESTRRQSVVLEIEDHNLKIVHGELQLQLRLTPIPERRYVSLLDTKKVHLRIYESVKPPFTVKYCAISYSTS